jgi:hypothetical protein
MDMCIRPDNTDEEVTQLLADLIGRTYTPDLLQLIWDRTERLARPNGPGHLTTKEHDPMRVNLMVDGEDIIVGFEFN